VKIPVYFTDEAERSFAQVGEDVVHVSQAIVQRVVRRLGPRSTGVELEEHGDVVYDEHTVVRTISTGFGRLDRVDTMVVVVFTWGPPKTPVLWVLGTFTALTRVERNRRLLEFKDFAEIMRRTPPTDG
jgi:hypothetical protein